MDVFKLPQKIIKPGQQHHTIMAMHREEAILKEGVQKFIAGDKFEFSPTLGGVNNIVKKVKVDDKDEYILRIYNNGDDSNKVTFEHLVLSALRKIPTSFQLPASLLSIDNGKTHELISDGSEASVFKLIPGTLPGITCVAEIGKACGELTKALASIKVDYDPQTPPYFEIYKVHHAINRDIFMREIHSPAFDEVRTSADRAAAEITKIEQLIAQLLSLNLPQQLIHGDLHYDNVLVQDGKVTGVLDFEFCAWDWRAMDLAISLSKYASEANAMECFAQLIQGYTQFVSLTTTEIEAVTDLVILRILSNVVYFVGRAMAEEDSIGTLTSRIDAYMRRIDWLRAHRQDIIGCFH